MRNRGAERYECAIPRVGVDAGAVVERVGEGERAIAIVAGKQSGAIHTDQLIACGLSRNAISRRRRAGSLHPLYPQVHLVGHGTATGHALLLAAVLSVGRGAVLSHLSAARLWRLTSKPLTPPIHVSILAANPRPRPGISIHRPSSLAGDDIRRRDLIPVTAPARTVLDVAAISDEPTAESALHQGRLRRLIRSAELDALRRRTPRARGWGVLGAILAAEHSPDYTRSEKERLLARAMRRDERIPRFRSCVEVGGYEVDYFWPEVGLVVELDTWTFHSHRGAFERDRIKWAEIEAAGFDVLVVTAGKVDDDISWVLSQVADRLERSLSRRRRTAPIPRPS